MKAPSAQLSESIHKELLRLKAEQPGGEHQPDDCEFCEFGKSFSENKYMVDLVIEEIKSLGPLAMFAGREVHESLIHTFMLGVAMGKRMGMEEADCLIKTGSSIPPLKTPGRIAMWRAKLKSKVLTWL